MAVLIDVSKTDDPRDVVHRAVQALAEGKLVVFPTDTAYMVAANGLHESAVARLANLRAAGLIEPLSLLARSFEHALDYAPRLPPVAYRLARRCWPGPLTLIIDETPEASLVNRLPSSVRQAVCREQAFPLRVPAHPLIEAAMRLSVGPLVVAKVRARAAGDETSVKASGDANPGGALTGGALTGWALTGGAAAATLGDAAALVLEAGRTRYAGPSSVARVRGAEIELVREGVIGAASLGKLASLMVLFVCTGNTCRSPMAETLMRGRVARRLGCRPSELADRGVLIVSAGVAAMAGSSASPEARTAVAERGLDLSSHESQPVSDRLVRFADVILAMTRGHRDAILRQWPEAAPRTRLLSRSSTDVSDPIGGPLEVYQRCANQIDQFLEAWEAELDWEQLPRLRRDTSEVEKDANRDWE
jgi:protein-tyrosine phosphatase